MAASRDLPEGGEVMTELVPFGQTNYSARVTQLKTGGRRDVEVTPADLEAPRAFGETDIVARMRLFFAAIDSEATEFRGDPVALSQALARLDALVADLRAVRDSVRTMTAGALREQKIRRLTVQGVTTVESTSDLKRTNWRHADLLGAMLNTHGMALLNTSSGELHSAEETAEILLEWFRPEWKMTPIKSAGLDPHHYCEVDTDDHGKPVATPSVRMINNEER